MWPVRGKQLVAFIRFVWYMYTCSYVYACMRRAEVDWLSFSVLSISFIETGLSLNLDFTDEC